MRQIKSFIPGLLVALLFQSVSGQSDSKMQYMLTENYIPDNQALYDTIVKLDSIFFSAYNNCSTELEKYASFYADTIEFYHDQAGLSTDKQAIVDATERNICGKVTRELVKGSIEVYPIKDYGAVEFGLHKFRNNQQTPGEPSKTGRFVIIWKHRADGWKISRVVSLH